MGLHMPTQTDQMALTHVRRVLGLGVWSFGELMSLSYFIGPQDDTFRIMLATDNHIGYMERDPIRGQDSINTFKEILQLAVKYDVSVCSHSSTTRFRCLCGPFSL